MQNTKLLFFKPRINFRTFINGLVCIFLVVFLLEIKKLYEVEQLSIREARLKAELYGYDHKVYDELLLPSITHILSYQRLDDNNNTFVLSAYFDNRPVAKLVRIPLYHRSDTKIKVFCHFYGNNHSLSYVSESYNFQGTKRGLAEIHNFRNRSTDEWAVNCYPPKKEKVLNYDFVVVSLEGKPMLLREHEAIKSPLLPIRNMNRELSFKHELGLCIKPMYDSYLESKIGLVEALELFMRSGITFIRVYMHDISPHMVKIFNYYQKKWACPEHEFIPSGTKCLTIEVVLYIVPNSKGQNIAEFDCLYRTIGHVKYLLLHDWDEIILPEEQEPRSLFKVISDSMEEGDGKSTLCFHNLWFPAEMNPYHIGQYAHNQFRFYGSLIKRDWLDDANTKCVLRPDHIVHQSRLDVNMTEPVKYLMSPYVATMQHHRSQNIDKDSLHNYYLSDTKWNFTSSRSLGRYIDKRWPLYIVDILKDIGIFPFSDLTNSSKRTNANALNIQTLMNYV